MHTFFSWGAGKGDRVLRHEQINSTQLVIVLRVSYPVQHPET